MVTELKTKNPVLSVVEGPKLNTLLLLSLMLMIAITAGCRTAWRDKLTQNLSVMGHRNWIVVADSAYPAQNRPGIAPGRKQNVRNY